MRRTAIYTLMILFAIVLVACGSAAVSESSGMGNMGMGGGMMARHHATIPEAYAGLSNPVPADDESLARGAETYTAHCASCHGDGGVGDGPASENLDPTPVNIAHTSQMMGDDYLFWRVSEGGAMEPFSSGMIAWKSILDEQARWDVLNYVQALGTGAVTPGQQLGGATFDPEVQAAEQAAMLATAVEQGVVTEEESAVFATVHEMVDAKMAEMRGTEASGGMDEMMADILTELVESGDLSQEQADTFLAVHDRLGGAGLMQ